MPNTYAPTLPNLVNRFEAHTMQAAFDDMATWSLGVGDQASGAGNIVNTRSVGAQAFRPGSLTKVWKSGSVNPGSILVYKARTNPATTDPEPWEDFDQMYDIPGASVNFYLRQSVAAGALRIHSNVSLWKTREGSFLLSGNDIAKAIFTFQLNGYLDGVSRGFETAAEYALTTASWSGITTVGTSQGLNLQFTWHNPTPVAAGLHKFKLRLLSQTAITMVIAGSSVDSYLFNHIKGSGARTTVTAIYK